MSTRLDIAKFDMPCKVEVFRLVYKNFANDNLHSALPVRYLVCSFPKKALISGSTSGFSMALSLTMSILPAACELFWKTSFLKFPSSLSTTHQPCEPDGGTHPHACVSCAW